MAAKEQIQKSYSGLTYLWPIQNVLLKDLCIKSPSLFFNSTEWRLLLYPHGYAGADAEFASCVVEMVSPENKVIEAECSLTVFTPAISREFNYFREFKKGKTLKCLNFIAKKEMLEAANSHPINDCFSIQFHIRVNDEIKSALDEKIASIQNLMGDLSIMLENHNKSGDVENQLEGDKNPNIKFGRLLEMELISADDAVIVDTCLITHLVNIIYANTKKSHIELSTTLIHLAEKYNNITLEKVCKDKLMQALAVQSAREIVKEAKKYNLEKVQDRIAQFIIDNPKEFENRFLQTIISS